MASSRSVFYQYILLGKKKLDSDKHARIDEEKSWMFLAPWQPEDAVDKDPAAVQQRVVQVLGDVQKVPEN